ncbi:MAG: GIY-YIG nuclease family protein [Flavobacteriaceae bacterium]|nr:GIY-YIG nuclease family protein [Flavobacteriaceae bacterium]
MYFTYILYSESIKRYYKGHTVNIDARLKRHNNGEVNYTSKGIPWKLVLALEKETRSDAMKLERKLKNLNRERLEAFIVKYSHKNMDNS